MEHACRCLLEGVLITVINSFPLEIAAVGVESVLFVFNAFIKHIFKFCFHVEKPLKFCVIPGF